MSDYGYIRIASAIPSVNVADCDFNALSLISMINTAFHENAEIIVFPEFSTTAYTCADLFSQQLLIDESNKVLNTITEKSVEYKDMLIVVGAPIRINNALFNCAIAISNGEIKGIVPKTYIPNYNEFYEKRWFTSSVLLKDTEIELNGFTVPVSSKLIFTKGIAHIFIEICEDLWVPTPPSSQASIAGANIILNLSATDEVIGKNAYLVNLIKQQSASTHTAYVYSSAGYGESSTDLVFAGNAIICENGKILAQSERFNTSSQLSIADVDVELLIHEREHTTTFSECPAIDSFRKITLTRCLNSNLELKREIDTLPFVPSNDSILNERCEEIINIQTMGLMRRLQFTHTKNLVVGISGGLDSTLALLIAVNAFDKLGLSRKGIHGITMPGFGTSDRTYQNAVKLIEKLDISFKEISIVNAVNQHFVDIDHDSNIHDVTYENCQARERTQILMDYANKVNGMVLGTGDLSELALGWATYNGDHMSMYGVNASIPKTLVKFLVRWFAIVEKDKTLKSTLLDVIDTPISPELIPTDNEGKIKQKTEDLVGPYELHDFFLYNFMRFGYRPEKIYFLAKQGFAGKYSNMTIKKWLTIFFKRFFAQQFKRSCLPDGPKVGSITLSPRGDWRMPSDASSKLWIASCEALPED